MRNSTCFPLLLLALVLLSGSLAGQSAVTASELAGPTVRLSVHSSGAQGNDDSQSVDITADGRYVVFESRASNLVDGDTNGASDIFVRDTVNGTTERVSISSGGTQGTHDSIDPAISDNGCYVVFSSYALNLVAGDTNNVPDVFLRDRCTHQTILVSFTLKDNNRVSANNVSDQPDISADGRYVIFRSYANNLLGGDTNGVADIYRYDRLGQTMARVTLNADGPSGYPSVSGNGRYVAFETDAWDEGSYSDIYMRDMDNSDIHLISVAGNGSQGDSYAARISDDGNHVVFTSMAANLVANDNNGCPDAFIRDRVQRTTRLVSLANNGSQANSCGDLNTRLLLPSVTAKGRYVAFQSPAANLTDNDYGDRTDVFVRDMQLNTTVLASVNSSGQVGNSYSEAPVIAASGRYVAFSSVATNLVIGDDNLKRDVFLHDLQDPPPPPPTLQVSPSAAAPGSNFAFSGEHYAAGTAVEIWVNGTLLSSSINAGSDGRLLFVIRTTAGPPANADGGYAVTVKQGSNSTLAFFRLDSSGSTRVSGSGQIVNLPTGVAPYTNFVFLPVVRR